MPVQRDHSQSTTEILERIKIEIAEERRREVCAKADEAENRIRNRDRIECGEARAAEAVARTARHENWRRWIGLAVAIAIAWYSVTLFTPSSIPIGTLGPSLAPGVPLIPPPSSGDDAGGDQPMTDQPEPIKEHLSSSKVQREVELALLKRLGKQLGVTLAKKRIDYNGAVMEVDGVDPEGTVFVEAFARMGAFKAGQKKKVGTDALKLVTLKAEKPGAKFILAFADQEAADSVTGWLHAVLDEYGIERAVVPISNALKKKLLATQVDQKTGMETGGA